jgi:hypothetical protein
MSTITTIQGSDLIKDSRADINNNFSALNTDKIETSTLDTDTTLAANSDSKIATQKAVKAYVDSGGNTNASETNKGIVEEATDAEVTAGTATGATGAKLFVTPAKLATRISTFTTPVVRTYLTAASPATWTKPAGLKYVIVEVQAGGGNGEETAGGGSGGYAKKLISNSSLGSTETITIGAAEGNSSFGSHCSANGSTAQDGGTATGGDINITGGRGNHQIRGFLESTGRTNARGGAGADSKFGNGGAGGNTGSGDANSATGYGAGGAGYGTTGSSETHGNAGAGAAGIVIVTEYYV